MTLEQAIEWARTVCDQNPTIRGGQKVITVDAVVSVLKFVHDAAYEAGKTDGHDEGVADGWAAHGQIPGWLKDDRE